MRIRTKLLTLMMVGALACAFSAPAVAANSSSANCSSSHSSSSSTYGGQGTQITGVGCEPGSTPPSTPDGSALPFTGLDIGLLVAAGAVLVATGLTLRWRLRHGGQ